MTGPDTNIILDDADLAEIDPEGEEFDGGWKATKEPEDERKFQFRVQMEGWHQTQFENVLVEVCAQRILGLYNDRDIAKTIEERCIALLTAKIDERMAKLTAEIINQPMIQTLGGKKETVTVAEFIGMAGRDYLAARVTSDGKPSDGGGYSTISRAEYLLRGALDRNFKNAIEKATGSLISEARSSVKKVMDAFVAAEKARVKAALDKAAN